MPARVHLRHQSGMWRAPADMKLRRGLKAAQPRHDPAAQILHGPNVRRIGQVTDEQHLIAARQGGVSFGAPGRDRVGDHRDRSREAKCKQRIAIPRAAGPDLPRDPRRIDIRGNCGSVVPALQHLRHGAQGGGHGAKPDIEVQSAFDVVEVDDDPQRRERSAQGRDRLQQMLALDDGQ